MCGQRRCLTLALTLSGAYAEGEKVELGNAKVPMSRLGVQLGLGNAKVPVALPVACCVTMVHML